MVNSETILDKELPNPGVFTFSAPITSSAKSVIVALVVDKTFSVPGDARTLGLVVKGIGFRND
jgi:hypothetical protein